MLILAKQVVRECQITRAFLDVNVILTFEKPNANGELQEFFDVKLPISSREESAVAFFDSKFFKKIEKKCQHLGRDVGDLSKISTAGNWGIFKKMTGLQSLPDLGHSCKWHFGYGFYDLDAWEKSLENEYGFGTKVDLSWVKNGMDGYLKRNYPEIFLQAIPD